MNKELGKIEKCFIGYGGYDDVMFGMNFIFNTHIGSVQDFISVGFLNSKQPEKSKELKAEFVDALIRYMSEAKIKDIYELKNKPVELTLDHNRLVSWRILTEVL